MNTELNVYDDEWRYLEQDMVNLIQDARACGKHATAEILGRMYKRMKWHMQAHVALLEDTAGSIAQVELLNALRDRTDAMPNASGHQVVRMVKSAAAART